MGSRLVAERDAPTVLGPQLEDAVLAALGKKRGPCRRRCRLEFWHRDILDPLTDQIREALAKDSGDPPGRADVDLFVVGDEPDLVNVWWRSRVLVCNPGGHNVECPRSDLVNRAGAFPLAFGLAPSPQQIRQ